MEPIQNKVTLEFEIQSIDPTRSTSQAVPEVEALAVELQSTVSQQFPGARVRIARVEGLPLGPALHHILVSIDWDVVKKGAEQAAAAFAATQFLNLLKTRVQNVIGKKTSPTEVAPAQPQEASGPTSALRKKRAKTSGRPAKKHPKKKATKKASKRLPAKKRRKR